MIVIQGFIVKGVHPKNMVAKAMPITEITKTFFLLTPSPRGDNKSAPSGRPKKPIQKRPYCNVACCSIVNVVDSVFPNTGNNSANKTNSKNSKNVP